jgi:hypothetical protein
MTREELIKRLRVLAKNHQDLSADTEALEACRKFGLKNIDTTKPGEVAVILENSPEIEPTVEEELETKALNSQELKEVLNEYDKHRELKAEEIATRIQRDNPLLKREEIQKVIQRKIELEAAERNKNIEVKRADKVSDERIIIEEKLKQEVSETKLTEEKIELIAERAAEIATREEITIKESREKMAEVIKEIRVDDKELAEEIVKTTLTETANNIVEENVDKVVEGLTRELADFEPTADQKEKIEEAVRERIKTELDDPAKKIDEYKAVVVEEGGRKTIKTGENLSKEIADILGNKVVEEEKIKIEKAVRNTKLDLDKKLFTNEINRDSPIDIVRTGKLEEEIIERMVSRGATREEAASTAKMIGRLNFPEKMMSESTIEAVMDEKNPVGVEQARTIKNLLKSPVTISQNVDKILKVSGKLGGIKGFDQLKNVAGVLKNNPKLMRSMEMIQKMARFQDTITGFTGGISTQIGNILHIPALQQFGVQMATRFGGEQMGAMAAQIANLGLKDGIKNILGSLFAGTTKVAGTAAVDAVELGAGVATGPPGWVITAILIGAQMVWGAVKKIWNWGKDKLESFLENIGVGSAKTKAWLQDNLGKGIGGLAYFGGGIAAILVAIPTMMGAVSVAIIAWLVPAVLGGLWGLNFMTANTVAPLVAPKGTGGSCVKLAKSDSGGKINCDQNAPENTVGGVDKANYIDVANRMKPGTNYAKECFNDTVNRALCAGTNPTYALWVWLHESGASNYSINEVADFGVGSISERQDFNAQITAFLKLDPASACIKDPRIGGDYWLAFSANFLNGDCDPDKLDATAKITPRQYEAEIKQQWGWISSSPMPNTIKVTPGGQNCDQIGESTTPSGNNSYTYTDNNGDMWLCENAMTENSTTYDPNTPGLTGVKVEGECSVSDKAILTRQCDPKWGNMSLNGGGTICSAGCGPTSVSMMAQIHNGSLTPPNIIFTKGSAYYSMDSGGSSLQQAQQELVKLFGSGVEYNTVTRGCDETAIAKWVCEGKIVMILADFYRNTGLELGGHFVLAVGVNGGKIVVYDPYYSQTNTPFDGTKAFGYAHNIKECLTVEAATIK